MANRHTDGNRQTEREKGRKGEGEKGRRGEREKGRKGEREKGRKGKGEKQKKKKKKKDERTLSMTNLPRPRRSGFEDFGLQVGRQVRINRKDDKLLDFRAQFPGAFL